MSKEYYQDFVTEKSFKILQELKNSCQFILIGGWAVFLYTQSLKSKDIDIVVDYGELEKLRRLFNLTKNDRLHKYEIIKEEIDIDIYVSHYSQLAIPAEEIKKYSRSLEGFLVPQPEIMLILKQKAHLERRGSAKGEKDKIDIIALLKDTDFDFSFYRKMLLVYGLTGFLEELKSLLQSTIEVSLLNLNQFQFSRFKKQMQAQLTK
ncbi:MAG: hypothetical protein V1712_01180 [Patescibacteria group bacterium]